MKSNFTIKVILLIPMLCSAPRVPLMRMPFFLFYPTDE